MLNPFPLLLVYSRLAPTIIRIVAGLIFLNLGFLKIKSEHLRWVESFTMLRLSHRNVVVNVLGTIEIIGGILLIIGLFTQIAALILSLLTLLAAFIEYRDPNILKRNLPFYILLFVMTLSLLFSGTGFLSFDLPL